MTLERIAQMREVYGPDLLLLIGGSLYSHSDNLIEGARHFMKLAGRRDQVPVRFHRFGRRLGEEFLGRRRKPGVLQRDELHASD